MNVGGHRQPRVRPAILNGQDQHGIYQAACIDLADTLGWEHGVVCYHWSQIAMAREKAGQTRDVAEDGALFDVRAVFDKRGCSPS